MNRKTRVGSEIDSYCGRCKMTLNHMVTAMVEDQPRRVRCLTCQSEHNHRLPKAKSSGRKRTSRSKSKSSTSRSKSAAAARWQATVAEWDDSTAKKYSIYESFEVEDRVSHKTFGKGLVVEVPGPDRMITLFESGEKMLMQGKQRS